MATLTRSELIELLERLGARDDAVALEAARSLNVKVADAGLRWSDLLKAGLEFDGDGQIVADDADEEEPDPDPDIDAGPAAPAAPGEDGRVIEGLLASGKVSRDLKAELKGLKRDIAEGEFTAMDSNYVRALAKRLGVKPAK